MSFIIDHYEIGGCIVCHCPSKMYPIDGFQIGDKGTVISKGTVPYNYIEVKWDREEIREYKYPDPITHVKPCR